GYTGLLTYSDRFWLLDNAIPGVVTRPLIEETDWVHLHLPASQHAAIVSSRDNLYNEFMLMSGARGQPIGLPSDRGGKCVIGRMALRMDGECIVYLHGLGIDDYFVV